MYHGMNSFGRCADKFKSRKNEAATATIADNLLTLQALYVNNHTRKRIHGGKHTYSYFLSKHS